MENERLKAILESLLFAAGEPVSLARLAAVLDQVPKDALKKALAEMTLEYSGAIRGITLEQVAGGYQFRTAKEHAFYVRKLLSSRPPRLSRPLLETLAIIAYRQPITRPEIEQLRGVDTGGVLETLLERHLIKIAGRKEVPGRPIIYATTAEFLETFGLKDLDSLPDLSEFKEIERRIEEAQPLENQAPLTQQAEGAGEALEAQAEPGDGAVQSAEAGPAAEAEDQNRDEEAAPESDSSDEN